MSNFLGSHQLENQLELDFKGEGISKTHIDESCYYVKDIADFLQRKFNGRSNVQLNEVWAELDNHPIFPSEGFRLEIKEVLKNFYNASISKTTISFVDTNASN